MSGWGTIPELVTISPASPPAHPTLSLSSYTFPHHPVFCVCYPPLAILALSQLDLSPASASLGADSTPSHCRHEKHQRALLVQASGSWWLLNQGLEFRLKNQLFSALPSSTGTHHSRGELSHPTPFISSAASQALFGHPSLIQAKASTQST